MNILNEIGPCIDPWGTPECGIESKTFEKSISTAPTNFVWSKGFF